LKFPVERNNRIDIISLSLGHAPFKQRVKKKRTTAKNHDFRWLRQVTMIKKEMTGEWELLAGRSRIEGWANGRAPVVETEKADLMPRSTIMCYEAIEFEPTPPAVVLQFDIIRRVLQEEHSKSGTARGVFGNCQSAVLALPNLYYFARSAAVLSYLDKPERAVLSDLAR